MTASAASCRRRRVQQIVRIAAACAVLAAPSARAAETVKVILVHASITKMPERMVTLVVGNPLIADVSIQMGGLLVITGKGYGTTNVIALDRDGAVLAERNIEVVGPQDRLVTVYRGVNRASYTCAPECQPQLTLGDGKQYFDITAEEISDRSTRARAEAGDADALWQLQPPDNDRRSNSGYAPRR